MDEAIYAVLPETLQVREVRVRVGQRRFRTRLFASVWQATGPNPRVGKGRKLSRFYGICGCARV